MSIVPQPDLNVRDVNGRTALMRYARFSKVHLNAPFVEMLINAGADVNIQNYDGWTALMLSASYSNTDSSKQTVKMLIDAGADLNIQTNEDVTALMYAARKCTTPKDPRSIFNTILRLIAKQYDSIMRKIANNHNVDRFVLRMIALEWKFGSSDPLVILKKLKLSDANYAIN